MECSFVYISFDNSFSITYLHKKNFQMHADSLSLSHSDTHTCMHNLVRKYISTRIKQMIKQLINNQYISIIYGYFIELI